MSMRGRAANQSRDNKIIIQRMVFGGGSMVVHRGRLADVGLSPSSLQGGEWVTPTLRSSLRAILEIEVILQ